MPPIPYREATSFALRTIAEARIVGMFQTIEAMLDQVPLAIRGGMSVKFERTWGAEVHLAINYKTTTEKVKFEKATYLRLIPEVKITWPSTGMSPLNALVAVTLFREVTEVAALVQARLDREVIIDKDTES